MTYYKEENNKIICQLCSHYCKLKEGQSGICGVNTNKNHSLITEVYGYPSALHVDPVEKKPLYHFLPSTFTLSLGTVGCNFKCPFCQNWQLSQRKEFDKSNYISPEFMVELALREKCKSISYTYNEPTIFYPYAKDIALKAKENGLKNVMVSNGYMSKKLCTDMPKVIDAINIDIKSFDENYYKKYLKGGLKEVLENSRTLKENGLHVEITTLLIPSIDEKQIKQIAKFISTELGVDTPWHLSAYHPDYKMLESDATPLEKLYLAFKIGKEEGLEYVYLGNIAEDKDTICPTCKEILIKRSGFGVSENKITNGKCPTCKTKINGVWK